MTWGLLKAPEGDLRAEHTPSIAAGAGRGGSAPSVQGSVVFGRARPVYGSKLLVWTALTVFGGLGTVPVSGREQLKEPGSTRAVYPDAARQGELPWSLVMPS